MTEKDILNGIMCMKRDWPENKQLTTYPGDFSVWAGDSGLRIGCFIGDPILDAPKRRASGGVFYLNTMTSRDGFQQELFNAGINSRKTRYAVFLTEAEKPELENFFRQMKIVTNFALRDYYKAIDSEECEYFPRQVCGIGEALWCFMGGEVNACNMGQRDTYEVFGQKKIRCQIRFGLAVERSVKVFNKRTEENDGVYRIWSQPYYPRVGDQ